MRSRSESWCPEGLREALASEPDDLDRQKRRFQSSQEALSRQGEEEGGGRRAEEEGARRKEGEGRREEFGGRRGEREKEGGGNIPDSTKRVLTFSAVRF